MMLAEISARLTAQALVSTGYSVFRGTLPDTPNKAIALYESGGSGADVAFDGSIVENPSLQIVTRGDANDRSTPLAAIQRIYQGILTWGAFVQSGTRYLSVIPAHAPVEFERDGNNRIKYTFNCRISKHLSAIP